MAPNASDAVFYKPNEKTEQVKYEQNTTDYCTATKKKASKAPTKKTIQLIVHLKTMKRLNINYFALQEVNHDDHDKQILTISLLKI